MSDLRAQVLSWIDADRDVFLDFLATFVQAKSPNPPGDTVEAAKVVEQFLVDRQLPYKTVAPNPVMPNFIGSFDGAKPGRHVVFNGHMDVFPVGDESGWTQDPWGGAIVDGKMYGRGVNDMKAGTASILFSYMYLHRLRDRLPGKVTMTAVSDEETFGEYGARYIIENNPEILGDVCLSTEPTGIHSVRFAEKGPLRLRFTVRTPGAHGAYTHKSRNANEIAAHLIVALDALRQMAVKTPPHITEALAGAEAVIDQVASPGAAGILQKVTLNIGTINGGVAHNMLPGVCELQADIRVPVGVTPDAVIAEARSICDRFPEATMEVVARQDPLWTDPNHEMCTLIQRNVQELAGFTPPAIVSLPGTDARLWRAKGIPAFVYGITPYNVAMADEYVDIEEVFHVLKTHTLSALDFMMAGQ